MDYHFRRKIFVTPQEMNKHLSFIKDTRHIRFANPLLYNEQILMNAYVDEGMKQFRVTYKRGTYIATYITCLDGDTMTFMTGGQAWNILCRYYKVPKRMVNFSAKQLLWKNPKYEGQRIKAYSYDKNSAFSWAMLQDMPDTRVAPVSRAVQPGEIGFDADGNRVTQGFALFVFPLMESPFKRFVEVWYDRKKNAKTKEERGKAKNVLNYSVGYLQLVNPFLRSQIIGLSNEHILSLMDDNTLYCNTDSIVSKVPRDDLVIGSEIGNFKKEHEGMFAYDGFNYQWDLNIPTYRGIPKSWFPKGWDILKDPLPPNGNTWRFNPYKFKLEKNKNDNKR